MTTKIIIPKDPITPGQAADARGVNRSRIHRLIQQERIAGAVQMENGQWLLPRAFKIAPPPTRRRKLQKL